MICLIIFIRSSKYDNLVILKIKNSSWHRHPCLKQLISSKSGYFNATVCATYCVITVIAFNSSWSQQLFHLLYEMNEYSEVGKGKMSEWPASPVATPLLQFMLSFAFFILLFFAQTLLKVLTACVSSE